MINMAISCHIVKAGEKEGSEITLRILAWTTGWIEMSFIEIGTLEVIG